MRVSPEKGVFVELTPRQAEIIELFADGLPAKGVAGCLGISEKTVWYHLKNIYMKTNTFNLVRLTKWAIRAGLSGLACMAIAAAAQVPLVAPTNPAPQLKLAWSPGGSPNIVNYNLYYGVGTRAYTNKTSLNSTATNTTVTLPARGVAFFFAVTCNDSTGLESGFSNEITYTAPNPPAPPTLQPAIVLTVQSAPTPAGLFADAGMNWSLSQDQAQQYYRLNINRGFTLSTVSPPMPAK